MWIYPDEVVSHALRCVLKIAILGPTFKAKTDFIVSHKALTPERRVRLIAYRMVGIQTLIVCGCALVWGLLRGWPVGYSIVLGGLCVCLPSFYVVCRVFRTTRPDAAKRIAMAFFVGEGVKLLASGLLVVIVLKTVPVVHLPFFLGFVAAIVGFWVSPLWVKLD